MQGRIRTFKPALFQNEELWNLGVGSGMPILQIFEGLWCYADREGRFEWKPLVLRGLITPFWEGNFGRALELLEGADFIRSYTVDGKRYGYVPGFAKHQALNGKERKSELPEPPEHRKNERVSNASASREERVPHTASLPFPSLPLPESAREPEPEARSEVFDRRLDEPPQPSLAPPTRPAVALSVVPPPPESSVFEKPSEGQLTEPTELQDAAERILHGGGRAEHARQRRRGTANRWPEVVRLTKLDIELRGSGTAPRSESDGRVQRILRHYADGFTPAELEDVIRRAHQDPYWANRALHAILKDAANFPAMGQPQKRPDESRREQKAIELTLAEAAKWR